MTDENAAVAMSEAEVFDRMRDIISESLGIDRDEIGKEMSFKDDLGADSLDLAELIMEFEDKFGVNEIKQEDADKIHTVGDAVQYVTNQLANQ